MELGIAVDIGHLRRKRVFGALWIGLTTRKPQTFYQGTVGLALTVQISKVIKAGHHYDQSSQPWPAVPAY